MRLLIRVLVSAQLLQIGWCLSVKYLAPLVLVVELLVVAEDSHSARKTERSWFVKLNLSGKLNLSVKERGVWKPSAHPFVLGKFEVGRSKESLSDTPHCIFLSCCPKVKPENAPNSVAAPSMGMQLFFPVFLGLLLSLGMFPSVLLSCLCFAPSPRLKLKGRVINV